MLIIKPDAEIIDVKCSYFKVLSKIEYIGRTCYKSTDKMTDDSASKFVSDLIKRGHEAMLEHASFCFEIDRGLHYFMRDAIWILSNRYNHKSYLRFTDNNRILVSGNVRAWREFFRLLDIRATIPSAFRNFIVENPVLFPELQDGCMYEHYDFAKIRPVTFLELNTASEIMTHCDVTVKFVVDRGVSHELVRHRPASFAQESTRYCNYGKDKFGNQLTFIDPCFFEKGSPEWTKWKNLMEWCETDYLQLIAMGAKPEEARTVLPNSIKTEVIMTANCKEWKHFFELRACNKTGKAHPQMLEVTRPLLDDFKTVIGGVFEDLNYE